LRYLKGKSREERVTLRIKTPEVHEEKLRRTFSVNLEQKKTSGDSKKNGEGRKTYVKT